MKVSRDWPCAESLGALTRRCLSIIAHSEPWTMPGCQASTFPSGTKCGHRKAVRQRLAELGEIRPRDAAGTRRVSESRDREVVGTEPGEPLTVHQLAVRSVRNGSRAADEVKSSGGRSTPDSGPRRRPGWLPTRARCGLPRRKKDRGGKPRHGQSRVTLLPKTPGSMIA
jgi:hypothetical protein